MIVIKSIKKEEKTGEEKNACVKEREEKKDNQNSRNAKCEKEKKVSFCPRVHPSHCTPFVHPYV